MSHEAIDTAGDSPLRGRWLTAVLGLVLLAGLTLVALTGFASHAAYEPRLPGNNTNPTGGLLHRWLLITGILFASSALVYAYRLWPSRSSPGHRPHPE